MVSLRGLFAAALAGALAWPGLASAQGDKAKATAFEEVLSILQRGKMIEEGEAEKVRAVYAAEQKKAAVPTWLDGLQINADFRARFDGTYFSEDPLGGEAANRGRGRYRGRFGFTKSLGDKFRLGFRLASGSSATGDRRSGNVSFGDGRNLSGGGSDEFSPDSILIDRVFGEFRFLNTDSVTASAVIGKTANPFVATNMGPDNLIFDQDISPEGAYLTSSFNVAPGSRLYASAGGFVIDEISGGKDPKLFGGQIGFEVQPVPEFTLGIRASGYQFRALDGVRDFVPAAANTFLNAAFASGNLANAFASDGDLSKARIGETTAFARFAASPSWPVVFYGQAIKNFDAESALTPVGSVGEENMAYGLGVEFGDAKLLQFGGGWFRVEANSVISQFSDSDLFEGRTNRQGWMLFARRRITSNVELRVTYLNGREIESSAPFSIDTDPGPGVRSALSNSHRRRILADASFSF